MPGTYTVMDASGNATRGLTVAAAAEKLLTADGYTYEVRPDDRDGGGYTLWISLASQNSAGPRDMTSTIFFSLEPDRAAAEAEIMQSVVEHPSSWHGLEAMTDEAYAALRDQREIAVPLGIFRMLVDFHEGEDDQGNPVLAQARALLAAADQEG